MRIVIILLILVVNLFAEPRKALLIANYDYKYVDDLMNITDRLHKLKRVLERLGFKVTIKRNLKAYDMRKVIDDFSRELAKDRDSVGLIYYSGHGFQLENISYLLPVDVNTLDRHVKFDAYSLNMLLDTMSDAVNKLNIIFLDACRNNIRLGKRGGQKGLARPDYMPLASLIMFATGAGETADDNTIFIDSIIDRIATPNRDILVVANSIANAVSDRSNNRQIPEILHRKVPNNFILNRTSQNRPQPQQTEDDKRKRCKKATEKGIIVERNENLTFCQDIEPVRDRVDRDSLNDKSEIEKVKEFIRRVAKVSEKGDIQKIAGFYYPKIDKYYSLRRVTRREVIKDKKHYYKVWNRGVKIDILDIKVNKKANDYYARVKLRWRVSSSKLGTKTGSGVEYLRIIKKGNRFFIKSVIFKKDKKR